MYSLERPTNDDCSSFALARAFQSTVPRAMDRPMTGLPFVLPLSFAVSTASPLLTARCSCNAAAKLVRSGSRNRVLDLTFLLLRRGGRSAGHACRPLYDAQPCTIRRERESSNFWRDVHAHSITRRSALRHPSLRKSRWCQHARIMHYVYGLLTVKAVLPHLTTPTSGPSARLAEA